MRYIVIILPLIFSLTAEAMPDIQKVRQCIIQAEQYDNDAELSKIQFAIGQIESDFGAPSQLVGDNDHSFGVFQIQAPTAEYIATKHNIPLPHSKTDIKALLIENEPLTVLLNRLLLKDLIIKYNNLKYAVIAYNQGEGNVDNHLRNNIPLESPYYRKFKQYYTGEYFSSIKAIPTKNVIIKNPHEIEIVSMTQTNTQLAEDPHEIKIQHMDQ